MHDRVFAVCLAALTASSLAGCGQEPGPSVQPGLIAPEPMGMRASLSQLDNWLTFGRDYARTGYQPLNVGLTSSSVAKLRLRWKTSVGRTVYAQPLVYDGNVVIVTLGGSRANSTVYDLSASDGKLLWQFPLEGGVRATPTIDPGSGLLIVSDRHVQPQPSDVYALRMTDGALIWKQPVPGLTHASPVIVNSRIYVGLSGGDPPTCTNGGIIALDEQTGKPIWQWKVNSAAHGGGSVWGPIAYNGQNIIFGTGNTCTTPVVTANGAVALDLDGHVVWDRPIVKLSVEDLDTGSGVLLLDGRADFFNKSGALYSVTQSTGAVVWSKTLGSIDGATTPSTDGTTIVEGVGLIADKPNTAPLELGIPSAGSPNDVFPGFHSRIYGLDVNGTVLWHKTMTNRINGDVTINNGMGFVALNKELVALDIRTGNVLWHSLLTSKSTFFDAPVVVVPSGVYAADHDGVVYAYAIP